jgi:hypothetical protein
MKKENNYLLSYCLHESFNLYLLKALVAGGLTLKKKNVSSLVEKWQKVQQDVTDEITKEEQKQLKMKKLAASSNSSTSLE